MKRITAAVVASLAGTPVVEAKRKRTVKHLLRGEATC